VEPHAHGPGELDPPAGVLVQLDEAAGFRVQLEQAAGLRRLDQAASPRVSEARNTEEAGRLGRLLDPLREPCFRRLAAGRAISVLGDWLLIAGLVGWVYERTGSTTHVAALMVVRFIPPIAGGAIGGVLADRLPRQRLLVAAELLCGAAVAGCLVGVLRGSEPLVFAGASLCALIAPLGVVSTNALVPDLVADARRPAGNAVLQIGQELAMASGALAAGITLSSGAAAAALGLDVASFAVAAYLFAGIRTARVATPRPRAAKARRGDALRHIFASRSLCSVAIAFPLVTLATGLTNATLPRHLTDLGLGPGGYGFGLAALAVGFALGEAAVGAVASQVGVGTLAAATAASCVPFAALAFAPSGGAAIAALGAVGLMQGAGEVALMTVIQQEAAPEFRGRAFGMVSTLIRTTMLGAVAAAPAVNALGSARHAVLASTAVTALAAAVAAARSSTRSLRRRRWRPAATAAVTRPAATRS
jgi:MFS family permease